MTTYFFDSSALVKRYVDEPGSEWVRACFTDPPSNTVFIAEITLVELAAAVARRLREGSVNRRQWRHFYRLLTIDHNQDYETIRLDHTIIETAMDLTERASLRAYDAVQLATAIFVQGELKVNDLPFLTFVTSDTDLLRAGADPTYQLQMVNPNTL